MSSGGAVSVVAAKEWHNSLTLTLLRSNAGDEPGTRVERGRVGGAAAFLREGALVTGFLSAGASAAGALGALCIQSYWQHCTSKKSWIPQGGDRPKVNQTIVACSLDVYCIGSPAAACATALASQVRGFPFLKLVHGHSRGCKLTSLGAETNTAVQAASS
jgi:hypothetical protein